MKITASQMRQDLRGKQTLRKKRAGGSGDEFPLRVAKITRVDAKKMTCSLFCLTGNEDSYDDVAITFPGAGGRSFLGVMPEVQDLCVVGFSPAESGSTRVPYIVGWLVASAAAGYDWVVSSTLPEENLNLTPALKEALSGSYGRRRIKLRQMEQGNLVGSSSQGSDLILNESVLLANRRGNEILLRDQDQALVTRTLQTFHAGAGVRVYSGMVQRDAGFLPTQVFGDGYSWDGNKQVDAEGNPISSSNFEFDPDRVQTYTPNSVFEKEDLEMGFANPSAFMMRGLFIDENGKMYDNLNASDAIYGGKPIYRVSVDGDNGVLAPGQRVFSEYRIEVSHTSDGTLPVTEQTDGVDIDRLLLTAPTASSDGGGDINPLNRSPNESMASLVLGTAVGNDPYWDRDSYGIPLVPQIYDQNGIFSPSIRGALPGENPSQHAAFLVRVRNPYDPKAPEAFLSITKGGTLRSYFPGTGSSTHQEFYQTGKSSLLGADKQGLSFGVSASGLISLQNTGRGRPQDNLGVEISSVGGAVSIYGGAGSSTDESIAVQIQSGKGILSAAAEENKITGQQISLTDADVIDLTANTLLGLSSGDTLQAAAKSWALNITGNANETFGGPKNGLPTNGPLRTTKFVGTPLTGAIGGIVDDYSIRFGNRNEEILVGGHYTSVLAGMYSISVADPLGINIPGSGISLDYGIPGITNSLSLNPLGAKLESSIGTTRVQAKIGGVLISAGGIASISSPVTASIQSPFVRVTVGALLRGGGVLTDGCLDPLSGKPFLLAGGLGIPNFRVI